MSFGRIQGAVPILGNIGVSHSGSCGGLPAEVCFWRTPTTIEATYSSVSVFPSHHCPLIPQDFIVIVFVIKQLIFMAKLVFVDIVVIFDDFANYISLDKNN